MLKMAENQSGVSNFSLRTPIVTHFKYIECTLLDLIIAQCA